MWLNFAAFVVCSFAAGWALDDGAHGLALISTLIAFANLAVIMMRAA